VRRTEPVTERLIGLPVGEKVVEVAADFIVELLFRRLDLFPPSHLSRHSLRKLIEPPPGGLVRELAGSVRGVVRRPRTPDLKRFADVVARLFEEQRIGRLRTVPDRPLQNCPPPGPPEVLPRQQRTAARGA